MVDGPYNGQSSSGGTEFDLSPVIGAAAPGIAVGDDIQRLNRQRPAQTPFPIPKDDFISLKNTAASAIGTLSKPATTLVQDSLSAKPELATMAVATPVVGQPMAPSSATPVAGINFQGIPNTGWFPPDCTMAVGPHHVLVSANSSVRIFNKTGGTPAVHRTLSTWFQNVVTNAKIFDPKALYDQHAERWILIAVAIPSDTTINDSWFLVSVSQTADPLSGWWNYALGLSWRLRLHCPHDTAQLG